MTQACGGQEYRQWLTRFLCVFQLFVIGAALSLSISAQEGGTQSPPPKRNLYVGAQVLAPTQDANTSEYVKELVQTIQTKWYEEIPDSATPKVKGLVVLRVRISKDGTLLVPIPTLEKSSGRKELDKPALDAVVAAEPYPHFPPSLNKTSLEFRLLFLYNVTPKSLITWRPTP